MEKKEPCLKPNIGCLNCGGGEMVRKEDEIVCALDTRIYQGFGGWHITKDKELVFMADSDMEWEDFPTLMKFEKMARKEPNHDWRAVCQLPLRDAVYQRQGENRWVLIESGMGFA